MLTELGKTIRKIRISRSELLYDMARKMGYGSAFLSGIENGKEIPGDFKEKLFSSYDLNEKEIKEINSILN